MRCIVGPVTGYNADMLKFLLSAVAGVLAAGALASHAAAAAKNTWYVRPEGGTRVIAIVKYHPRTNQLCAKSVNNGRRGHAQGRVAIPGGKDDIRRADDPAGGGATCTKFAPWQLNRRYELIGGATGRDKGAVYGYLVTS